MYLLGYDSGTSSVKATLMEVQTGEVVASATYPSKEMLIISRKPGWAEQSPDDWWKNLRAATAQILSSTKISATDIKAIGITYQMHGLVCVDKNQNVLRPSIIWCDSRAVPYGKRATDAIGAEKCLETMLNHPGNFTAAKLAWVKENEPEIFGRIHKIMLPGDYLAMKMTGRIVTTKSGLSEGILWDFKNKKLASEVMEYFGFDESLIPEAEDTFAIHGKLTKSAAEELGLKQGTDVSYRAGDQPNNAFSLGVLEPGQIAATAGTSGVIYGVIAKPCYDEKSRVNVFVHVNNTTDKQRYGVLLCINGTGILNSWLKHNAASGIDYPQMNELAATVPIGSDGLTILPYGNGAERTLENKDIASAIIGLQFNNHTQPHLFRAAQEGIAFAFNYGLEITKQMALEVKTIRAGKANMFQSSIFARTLATIAGADIELYNTDGSQGAARGAGLGAGIYKDFSEAFAGLEKVDEISPDSDNQQQYEDAYEKWHQVLKKQLER
ncbi:MAG: carbohydrate kinase [Sedimentisphaerales bacterium]|nr:carbohydrate kinase [Sedimentisphaerales bacterium]